jgi:hypothetical protein
VIIVNKSALVDDFVHILKMHGQNSIKLMAICYEIFSLREKSTSFIYCYTYGRSDRGGDVIIRAYTSTHSADSLLRS